MKQLFIGLLIIAAGAGVYYLLQKKKNETGVTIEKKLLVGTWKMDSLYLMSADSATAFVPGLLFQDDSTFRKSRFHFQKGGTFLQTLDASPEADTSYYEWGKKNELLIRESVKGSTGEVLSVNKLNIDSLILQSKDSVVFVLTKLK